MAGPVWRFARGAEATCGVCFRRANEVYVEGEVVDNELRPLRSVCPACFAAATGLLVRGEVGHQAGAPGYARR